MTQEAKSHETLRKLAMIHEGFVQGKARPGLDLTKSSALDSKMAALLAVVVAAAIGSSSLYLRWSASRALAAGATEEEIADMLLAIAPVAGLGPVVRAAPDLAAALGYDVDAALYDPGDP